MLRRFRLEEPETVQEASSLLSKHGESARIYSGGTELLLAMKEGLVRYDSLINLKNIPELNKIKIEDGKVHIGALCTHWALETSTQLRESLPTMADMESKVANLRVRAVGTIGGNLSFAEPHADPGTFLLSVGASLIAQNASSSREIFLEKFFVDAFETSLKQDEVLTEIRVPLPSTPSGTRYIKFGHLERPSVGVALHLALNGDGRSIGVSRVAVGCVGPIPCRVEAAEEVLRGKSLKEAAKVIGHSGELASRAAQAITDIHGSADYKEHIVQVLLTRAFNDVSKELTERKG